MSERRPQTMFEAMDDFGAATHELWLVASRPLVHLLDWLARRLNGSDAGT